MPKSSRRQPKPIPLSDVQAALAAHPTYAIRACVGFLDIPVNRSDLEWILRDRGPDNASTPYMISVEIDHGCNWIVLHTVPSTEDI